MIGDPGKGRDALPVSSGEGGRAVGRPELARNGEIDESVVTGAISDLKIDADKPEPETY